MVIDTGVVGCVVVGGPVDEDPLPVGVDGDCPAERFGVPGDDVLCVVQPTKVAVITPNAATTASGRPILR